MEPKYLFDSDNLVTRSVAFAKAYAKENYTTKLETVLKAALQDKRNLPKLGFTAKVDKGQIKTIPLKDYSEKWVDKYLKGYDNRPSKRIGKASKTFPDSLLKELLLTRLAGKLLPSMAGQIEFGHSLLMTLENLVGDMLEEYLSERLLTTEWACCWGSSIDAVDFCKLNPYDLLQIKNSDNSENSASSRVRAGTTIKKWSRRVSTKKDKFEWDSLNTTLDTKHLSEKDFREFCQIIISKNPNCLYVSVA